MGEELTRIAVIGPVYPYKGGISHYTGLLIRALRKTYEVEVYSYRVQYPKLLFKREQRDDTNKRFAVEGTRYLIHTANPFTWRGAAKKICECAPDMIILQWWHPYFAPCDQAMLRYVKRYAKQHGGRPRILFLCHNVLPHERFVLDAWLTRGTLKRADFCIVHSTQDQEDLRRLLPQIPCEKQVHPSYNAFRLRGISRDEARKELQIAQTDHILLFFGFVRKYKGLSYLIEAMGKLRDDPQLRLYIVGDFGDRKEVYAKQIAREGISERVVICDGYVPDTEVEPYFAAADLCICPYLSATQSGIVQIAYGFGLPVIATAVGGLPEAVTDGVTGYIVPPADAAALANAIRRYFREDAAIRFRENVAGEAERFSWDRMTETITAAYKRMAAVKENGKLK